MLKLVVKDNQLIFKPGNVLPVNTELEPSCYKKQQKSPNQETGLGNRGSLKVLNDTKLILKD